MRTAWIKDVQHTVQLRTFVNLIMNIQFSLKALNFLASWEINFPQHSWWRVYPASTRVQTES